MAIDSTLPVRRAILMALQTSPHLNELLPADQIHSLAVPALPDWPFALYENFGASRPIVGTCLDGQESDVRIHVFGKKREVAGFVVETAEDFTGRIMGRVCKVLDRRKFDIEHGRMTVAWRGSYLEADEDEADASHGFVSLRIRCMTQ